MAPERYELSERDKREDAAAVDPWGLDQEAEASAAAEQGDSLLRREEEEGIDDDDDDDDKAALLRQTMADLGGDDVRTPLGTVEAMIARVSSSYLVDLLLIFRLFRQRTTHCFRH